MNPEWWLVTLTGLLVAVTAALALFTARLWSATGKLVRGADATAQRQLRAYIYIEAAVFIRLPTNQLQARLMFKNVGQTPAHDVRQWMGVMVARGEIDYRTPDASLPISSIALGPSNSTAMQVSTASPVGDEWWPLLESGEASFYVYGSIRYRDVFDVAQVAHYRYRSTPDGFKTGVLSPCVVGNEST